MCRICRPRWPIRGLKAAISLEMSASSKENGGNLSSQFALFPRLAMRSSDLAVRVCGLLLPLFVISAVQAGDELLIQTANGRLLKGAMDERTDADTLWVRRTEGNIILTSSVKWSEIESAELAGQSITTEKLAEQRDELATATPVTFLTESDQPAAKSTSTGAAYIHRKPSIANIEIEAALANLDRTVESDGLLVAIAALDQFRNAHAVRGSLSARLVVERLDYHTGEVSFEEFGRWTKSISEHDFHEGIAEFSLRFRRYSPEFDWELCTAALLNVRLSVHGQGNFEASVPIAIHEYNPIRDEMRNWRGSRFFRNELTRNTLHDGPIILHKGYSAP
jgi:hypothetical protein